MSGDWAKVELNTPDKSEIWMIAEILDIDPDAAFGKVFRVWAWFDEHTENGNASSVTKRLLDRKVGVTGFCDAMLQAKWMIEKDDQIILTNFGKHNGETAKKRANTAKRVAKHRVNTDSSESSAESVTEALAREEKRREEKNKEKKETSRFTPPTLEEVIAYCRERKNTVEANKFIDHYEANGWMRGKNKIKDWKACVRTWEAKEEKTTPSAAQSPSSRPTMPKAGTQR